MQNGSDFLGALALIDNVPRDLLREDPEVILPSTANLSALAVDWMGFNQLIRDPSHRKLANSLPLPSELETGSDYVKRIWPLLSADERGAALDLGLQKMVTMNRVAETGIQVRIWRAYCSGEWLYSPACETQFRPWVRSVLTDDFDSSASEASKLASVCEVIGWLAENGDMLPGIMLPGDLEVCFRRPDYRRWKAIAPKILRYVAALKEEDNGEEIKEEIAALVKAVYNRDLSVVEVEVAGRQKEPRMPTIVAIEGVKDRDTGRYPVTMYLSEVQRSYFQRKLAGMLDYKLQGEQPTSDLFLVEYRHCNVEGEWSERLWHEETGWSSWHMLDKAPDFGGFFDSMIEDSEIGLSYYRYWERIE